MVGGIVRGVGNDLFYSFYSFFFFFPSLFKSLCMKMVVFVKIHKKQLEVCTELVAIEVFDGYVVLV